MKMGNKCIGNCITCGTCTSAPVLEAFSAVPRAFAPRPGHGIAVDIGTTTVVLALVDLTSGKAVARHSFQNPQRAFGPDVISRIDAANHGHLAALSGMIRESVSDGVVTLLQSSDLSPSDIQDMTIGANTVMAHLLLGLSCESLGVVPFQPMHLLEPSYDSAQLFPASGLRCEVRLAPWIAGYVGGDVTAGLLHVLPYGKGRFLLTDLGTNGELALYDEGQLIVTATAAGPAFEQPVSGESRAFQGASEVISALALLVREEIVDESGLLEQENVFTQKQIRDLQLAKSAIRSGMEILLEVSGLAYQDLDAIYLAGGIGQAVDVRDAADIGLIPREFEAKAIPVGNASLGGAIAMLTAGAQGAADIETLLRAAREINLAAQSRFNEHFMEYMSF